MQQRRQQAPKIKPAIRSGEDPPSSPAFLALIPCGKVLKAIFGAGTAAAAMAGAAMAGGGGGGGRVVVVALLACTTAAIPRPPKVAMPAAAAPPMIAFFTFFLFHHLASVVWTCPLGVGAGAIVGEGAKACRIGARVVVVAGVVVATNVAVAAAGDGVWN
jgi:hypothetical protein